MMNKNDWINIILYLIIIIIVVTITFSFLSNKCPPVPETIITFDQIKDKMHTGDVILLNGSNPVRSNLIRAFIRTNLTHAGIILKGKYDDSNEEKLFMMDISPFRFGATPVKIRLLSEVFDTMINNVNCWLPLTDNHLNITKDDIQRYKQLNYNYSILGLYSATETKMVCSSFIGFVHNDKNFNPQGKSESINWKSKSLNAYAEDSRAVFFRSKNEI